MAFDKMDEKTSGKKSKTGFFSRFFGKKNKDDVDMGSNSANEQRAYGTNFKEHADNFYKFGVTEANDLFEVGKKLGKSFKLGRKGNSDSFEAIGIMLVGLNDQLARTFSFQHKETNDVNFDSLISTFDLLISCCDAYLAAHEEPKSIFGKNRRELVMKLKGIAQVDKSKLSGQEAYFKSLTADQQSQVSVLGMLRSARTVQLHTDDFEQLRDSKATGGQASDVMKLSVNGDDVRGVEQGEKATHYFKFEDEIDLSKGKWEEDDNGEMKTSFNASMTVDNILKRYPGLPSEDEKFIREWSLYAKSGTQKKDLPLDKLSAKGQEVLLAVYRLVYGGENTFDILDDLKLNKTKNSINMSNRNVATSRVAELLGVGNLVAKSERVDITDNNGKSYKGNLMESAISGQSARAAGREINKGKSEDLVEEASKGEGYQIELGVTGGFQRDLCNLQILDCICGQIDRHTDNYMVTRDENGELSGLQGIDNDASFGLNEDNTFSTTRFNRNNRGVVDLETGGMCLPFIDDKMAKSVEALEPSALEYVLKDLLTKNEIKACISRFNKIKKAIQKTRLEQPERFLQNEDDWNDDTAQKMVDDSWEKYGNYMYKLRRDKSMGLTMPEKMNRSVYSQTYFGRFMGEEAIPFTNSDSWGRGVAPRVKRHDKK